MLMQRAHNSKKIEFFFTIPYVRNFLLVRSIEFFMINFEHEKSNLTEILTDGIILEKNLILLKNLNGLDRNELGGKEPVFIDVWPVSILDSDQILTDGHFDFDESSLFLLQLGKYQLQQKSHVIKSDRLLHSKDSARN